MSAKLAHTRHIDLTPGSEIANLIGETRGRFTVEFGLHYIEGNSGPYIFVTADYIGGCGCMHDAVLTVWPDLKPLTDLHLTTPGQGPMHYVANAVYWWEKAVGISKWEQRSYDPDPTKTFRSHCLWGQMPGDDEDNPLAWRPNPDLELDPALAWNCIRGRLRARLRRRLGALNAHTREVLQQFDLDPDWVSKPLIPAPHTHVCGVSRCPTLEDNMLTSEVKGAHEHEYEISSDGRTVWVNDENGCRARFGPKGYDFGGSVVRRGPSEPRDEFLWRCFMTQCRNKFGIDTNVLALHAPLPFEEA